MTSADSYKLILENGNPYLQVLCIGIGTALGIRLISRRSLQWNLNQKQRKAILFSALLGALIGSSLPSFFAGDVIELRAFKYLITPKTMLGGLMGSFLSVAMTKILLGIKEETSDSFAVGTALMLAIGRIGCFFGHCCYGIPHHWGIDFGDGITRLPTQLIEAVLMFGLWIVFSFLEKKGIMKNRLLFLFFAIYGVLRFFLEYLRAPISRTVLGLGFYQFLSVILFGLGVYQLISRRRLAMHQLRVS